MLTTARDNISSVSSGSCLYSDGLMTWESTRAKSEPKMRCEAGLLTVVGLSHAEDVANRATRGVADYYQPASKQAKAEDAAFTVVFACVFDLDRHALEDSGCVFKVLAALSECSSAFGWIVGDSHLVIVSTKTKRCNRFVLGFASARAAAVACETNE